MTTPYVEPDLGSLDHDPDLLPDPAQDWSAHEHSTDPDPRPGVAPMGLAASPIRWVRGKRACSCWEKIVPHVEAELRALGAIKQDLSGLITQGSYNTTVSASAGTHAGGGVWDVKHALVSTDAKKEAWLEWGVIPFERTRADANWAPHGHLVVVGCPHLHSSAARQVTAARSGRNALKNNADFRGLNGRPQIISWQTALNREAQRLAAEALKKELAGMKLDDIVPNTDGLTVAQCLARGAWAYEQIIDGGKISNRVTGNTNARAQWAYASVIRGGSLETRVAELERRLEQP